MIDPYLVKVTLLPNVYGFGYVNKEEESFDVVIERIVKEHDYINFCSVQLESMSPLRYKDAVVELKNRPEGAYYFDYSAGFWVTDGNHCGKHFKWWCEKHGIDPKDEDIQQDYVADYIAR